MANVAKWIKNCVSLSFYTQKAIENRDIFLTLPPTKNMIYEH